MKSLFVCMLLILLTVSTAQSQAPIDSAITDLWRNNALLCENGNWSPFPTKMANMEYFGTNCDDGDMSLFNSLLCAVGELQACTAIHESLDSSGRLYRSPRYRVIANDGTCASVNERIGEPVSWATRYYDRFCRSELSADMGIGFQLYVSARNDPGRLQQWIQWIENNRPHENLILGYTLGPPRFCRNDTCRPNDLQGCRPALPQIFGNITFGCTVRPGDAALLRQSQRHFNIPDTNFQDYLDAAGANLYTWTTIDSYLNASGFSLHILAVTSWVLRWQGETSPVLHAIAERAAARQPRNPFYLWLRDGSTEAVRDLVISRCPTSSDRIPPVQDRNVWMWETADADAAKEQPRTMLWDCIFMARLLERSDWP